MMADVPHMVSDDSVVPMCFMHIAARSHDLSTVDNLVCTLLVGSSCLATAST